MRIASLNLCSDELVLMLADPARIASVTHLSRNPAESALWWAARRTGANDGSLLSVAPLRPDLIVTMGGSGRDRAGIARAIGARLIDLPFPATLADVVRSIRIVGDAVGRPDRGRALARRIAALSRTAPARRHDAIYLSGGGRSLSAEGLGAQWLALAGYRQRPLPGGRIDLETLLRHPPAVLLTSDYRAGQASREAQWLRQPALSRMPRLKRIRTEGRRWTCLGPSLIPEIARLRALDR